LAYPSTFVVATSSVLGSVTTVGCDALSGLYVGVSSGASIVCTLCAASVVAAANKGQCNYFFT